MTTRLVTDSTCDLTADLMHAYRVSVVPLHIRFGTEDYVEGVTIDGPAFYRKVEETKTVPTTSQPSVGEFVETFRQLADEGAEDIISVHVGGKMSGTHYSAEMAGREVAGRVRVHAVDSGGGSAGLGYMMWEAGEMVAAGCPVAGIVRRLEEMRAAVHIFLALDNLRYAQMSGRVGTLQSTLASLLNVKPIVALHDGELDVIERARSRGKAVDRLVELTGQAVGSGPVNVAVIHAQAPREAEALLARVQERFECRRAYIHDLATSVAVHLGPGTVGLVSYQA